MTERVFDRAVEINKKIHIIKEKLEELKYAQKLCWGNTSEAAERIYQLKISSSRTTLRTDVIISSDSAKLAFDMDIQKAEETLAELQREFSKL